MARKKKETDGTAATMTASEVIDAAQAEADASATPATPPTPQQAPQKTPVEVAMERIKKAIQRAKEAKDFAKKFGLLDKLTKAVMDLKDWENLPVAVAQGTISTKEVPGAIIVINEAIRGLEHVITEVNIAHVIGQCKRLEDGIRVIEGDDSWKRLKENVDLTIAYKLLDRSAEAIKSHRLKGIGKEVEDEADRLWAIIVSYCRDCRTPLPDHYVKNGWRACKVCNDAYLKRQKEAEQQAQAKKAATVQSLKDRIRAAAKP